MDEFEVLTEGYGLKSQRKSAPMAASRTTQNRTIDSSFDYPNTSSRSASLDPSFNDFHFGEKTDSNKRIDDDLFGLTFKLSKSREDIGGNSSFDYDFIFGGSGDSNFDSSFNNFHKESMFDSVAEGDILGFGCTLPPVKSGVSMGTLLGDFGDMNLGFGDLKVNNNGGEGIASESVSDDLIPGFDGGFHHKHGDVDKTKEGEKGSYVQNKNQKSDDENEMDLFFSGGKETIDAGTKAQDFNMDTFFENKAGSAVTPMVSGGGVPIKIKKECAKSDTYHGFSFMFDDLKACGDFSEIDGESEERRAARWKRHQDTIQRMAKAVSDMNQRDLETLHQQEERNKISESVNIEMKQWVTGKEGNLRALLSTLHKVLWPECGWKPVPLTELITSMSVKRVYKRAALCVHPDKVQQKGASPRQKYVAEKAFDILKEAWNKFNAEELR